uniref:RHNO1 n=1 Tax=Heterorhabditis bacteriophora TaxID=37862 RepID=A0A1I7WE23_HETBA
MKSKGSTARPKTLVWRTPKANRKSIHQAGKNEEVSDFNSRSQESQDGFCPCTHAMDSGNSFFQCTCVLSVQTPFYPKRSEEELHLSARQYCHPRELQPKGLVSAQEHSPYGLAVSVTGPKSLLESLGNITPSSLCPQHAVFFN